MTVPLPVKLYHNEVENNSSLTHSDYPFWKGTNEYRDHHIFSEDITFTIIILVIFISIPIMAFIYGCVKKNRDLREEENSRQQRIEGDSINNASPWQKAIRLIPRDQVVNNLSKLMHTFKWIKQESEVKDSLPESLDDKSFTEESNADYCAICLSHFEDQDEIVQSSINVCADINRKTNANLCVHKFHKSCMIEWLLLSKEPLCPFCRREYLDKGMMMEEGLIRKIDSQEELSGELRLDRNTDTSVQNQETARSVDVAVSSV